MDASFFASNRSSDTRNVTQTRAIIAVFEWTIMARAILQASARSETAQQLQQLRANALVIWVQGHHNVPGLNRRAIAAWGLAGADHIRG